MSHHRLIRARTEADLRWFYGEAERELGLTSNHMAVISILQSGVSAGWSPDAAATQSDHRMGASQRWTKIAGRLRNVGQRDERILRLAFLDHRWPGLQRWGRLAGVACLTPSIAAAVRKQGRRVIRRKWSQRMGHHVRLTIDGKEVPVVAATSEELTAASSVEGCTACSLRTVDPWEPHDVEVVEQMPDDLRSRYQLLEILERRGKDGDAKLKQDVRTEATRMLAEALRRYESCGDKAAVHHP